MFKLFNSFNSLYFHYNVGKMPMSTQYLQYNIAVNYSHIWSNETPVVKIGPAPGGHFFML